MAESAADSEQMGGADAAGGAAAIARQEIEYLRRRYAKATDLFGVNTSESIAEGNKIYHRIFTANARIQTSGSGSQPLESVGPDGWAKVANTALKDYVATQHLIGTQLVDIEELNLGDDGAIVSGEATMTSYLQAWHAGTEEVFVFIGTYVDKVRYTPGVGWQIYDMNLVQVSGETRPIGGPRTGPLGE
ncbi:MAG: nuclear transport factor 2 family protein [Gammaproteobacteria bacterium]|nr:nuclear transport factor 2 family protein [Gammaproteobacteria bacterium]